MPRSKNPILKVDDPYVIPSQTIGNSPIEARDSNFTQTEWFLETIGDIQGEAEKYYNPWVNQQGKWIIKFTAGDPAIDNAWKAVLKGIRNGVFYEAKFTPINENFPGVQEIIIYSYDSKDVDDIIFIHDQIQKRGICNGAVSTNIEYKTNDATQKKSEERLYDSKQIEKIKSEKPGIASFLLNLFTSEAFTAFALLIVALAISATIIGATLMGAPVVAAAVAGTGLFLALGTLAVVGFFCKRDETKSLDEAAENTFSQVR